MKKFFEWWGRWQEKRAAAKRVRDEQRKDDDALLRQQAEDERRDQGCPSQSSLDAAAGQPQDNSLSAADYAAALVLYEAATEGKCSLSRPKKNDP